MSVITIIVSIFLFCLLVVSHEFGHFITSKIIGVKVEEFSMGMGPLIVQKQKGETLYSIRALPIGGYCRLQGEDGDEPIFEVTDEDGNVIPPEPKPEDYDPSRSFSAQKSIDKIVILAAGAIMNVVLCLILLVGVFTYTGTLSPTLSEVVAGGPADIAGIKAGDTIVAVNGTDYESWTDIVAAINATTGDKISFTVERSGELLDFTTGVSYAEDGRPIAGIVCSVEHSLIKAVPEAFKEAGSMVGSMKLFLNQLVHGQAKSEDVVGVVGIVSVISEQSKYGLYMVVYIMALMSMNLAMVNMLPFPALDGGRILFVIIRALTGGLLSERTEAIIHAIGMIILLGLMVFLVFKDTFTFIL